MRSCYVFLLVLLGCGAGAPAATPKVRMTDDLPVAHADLRALFEVLDDVSGRGYECDHAFSVTRRFLSERKLPVDDMLRWLGENGAGCDCEIVFNVEPQWSERVGYVPKE